MKPKRIALKLRAEIIRELTPDALGSVLGGNRLQPATDGATNCISEIAVCPTHDWSCVNHSCTSSSLQDGPS